MGVLWLVLAWAVGGIPLSQRFGAGFLLPRESNAVALRPDGTGAFDGGHGGLVHVHRPGHEVDDEGIDDPASGASWEEVEAVLVKGKLFFCLVLGAVFYRHILFRGMHVKSRPPVVRIGPTSPGTMQRPLSRMPP